MSAGGVQQVAARIAEIQAQITALRSSGRVGGVVGSGMPAERTTFAEELRARTGPAPAARASARAAAADAGTAPGARAAVRSTAAVVPPSTDAWTAALPDDGAAWSGAITAAAERHGVDPRLLASLVWAESGFRPQVVSHAGAIGLAQLMPGTAAGMGVDPHDPAQNLDGGARYLRAQLDRFGSVDLALAAYNAGPGRVAEAGGIPRIAETQAYVPRVLGYYDRLKEAS